MILGLTPSAGAFKKVALRIRSSEKRPLFIYAFSGEKKDPFVVVTVQFSSVQRFVSGLGRAFLYLSLYLSIGARVYDTVYVIRDQVAPLLVARAWPAA